MFICTEQGYVPIAPIAPAPLGTPAVIRMARDFINARNEYLRDTWNPLIRYAHSVGRMMDCQEEPPIPYPDWFK